VTGSDSSIKYTTDRVRVKVTIAEAGNGRVEATKYEYLTDTVFTNEYTATGNLTLAGTKKLESSSGSMKVRKDEFSFVVKEGTTQVATGTTEANGNIKFTEIKYFASDIGTHTYVISEVKGNEANVKYTASPVTVTVEVTDDGNGNLTATPKYQDGADEAVFVNEYDAIVPAGIHTNALPYVMMIAIATCAGMLLTIYKRKRRSVRRR
jgi:pilin isopeptide linkage protein